MSEKFWRRLHKKKEAIYASRNMRRKYIICKYTIFVYFAYIITILSSVLARAIGLVGISPRVLAGLFAWVSSVTVGLIAIVLTRREITLAFANRIYIFQFIIWLISYAIWVFHLETIRFMGLLFAIMAMVFLFSRAGIIQSILLALSISLVHVAVSYVSIHPLGQGGSFLKDLFFTLCFFPVALSISFLTDQYNRHKVKPGESAVENKSGNGKYVTLTPSSIEKIEKAIAFIEEHYRGDISRDALAARLGISPNYLGKLFAEHTGRKMNDFITDLRINESRKLLRETDEQIIEIAYTVGFNNLRHFNRVFKEKVGVSPQNFRKSASKSEIENNRE